MKYILLALVLILCPFSFSEAQVGLSVVDDGLVIDIEPLYPEPETEFTATLNDSSFSAQINGIKWKVDGAIVPEATNQRTITLQTKAVGKKIVLEASVELIDGSINSVKRTIDTNYLDIIIEPQTRTPSFYKGRSLPSIDSKINLTAIVNGETSNSNLIYNWRLNNTSVEGGPIRGKNKTTVTMPMGNYIIVSLDITNTDGEFVAMRSIQIPSVSPRVLFYEVNPIYGQGYKALNKFTLVGDSTKIKAEPYDLDLLTYNSPDILEWEINGYKNSLGSGNPYEVTLAREDQDYTGASNVDFHVRSLKQLLQGAEGDFQINF
jgi:hypothetical protein